MNFDQTWKGYNDWNQITGEFWGVQRGASPKPAIVRGLGAFKFSAGETLSVNVAVSVTETVGFKTAGSTGLTPFGQTVEGFHRPSVEEWALFDAPPPNALAADLGVAEPGPPANRLWSLKFESTYAKTAVSSGSVTFSAANAQGQPTNTIPEGKVVYPQMKAGRGIDDGTVTVTAKCTAAPAAAPTIAVQTMQPAGVAPSVVAPSSVAAQSLPALTELILSVSTQNSRAGKPLTLIARATPATAAGMITFSDGDTPICSNVALAKGSAKCRTSFSKAGEHVIVARYNGGTSFGPSTSAPIIVSVAAKRAR
jgi:hypothetical protein